MTEEEKKDKRKKYREENKEKINEQKRLGYLRNKDKILLANKEYREKNKEFIVAQKRKYSENNKHIRKIWDDSNRDRIRLKNREWINNNQEAVKHTGKKSREKNKENIKISNKNYILNNLEKVKNTKKIYYEKNKSRLRGLQKICKRKRKLNDPLFKLSENIRVSIYRALNGNKKQTTHEILGCSFEEFQLYIESKFEPWMNWSNYGNWNGYPSKRNIAWDLDHIIPIAKSKNENELLELNHYSNFQPLCSYFNRYIKRDN